MKSQELRKKYIEFFVKKGHKEIPSAPLVPENDPTTLFTAAGMHPLVPFLLGQPHPAGQRLVNFQKCVRTDDIDEVGDTIHHTFFEMLGNWSLGDYFKKEAISWSYEFLTQELNLDPKRLYITCFAGDEGVPKDTESAQIWQSLGIPPERIFFLGKKDNFWGPVGESGPCGPDTEMHYDITQKPCGPNCQPGDNCGRFSEIWNDVFMEYNKTKEGKYEPLGQKNVDTGMGLERALAVVNNLDDDYQTDLFLPIIQKIEEISNQKYLSNPVGFRIIADHLRAATFILTEKVSPSNIGQGYIIRRLIRRSIRYGKQLGINQTFTSKIAETVIDLMKDIYPELERNSQVVKDQLKTEEEKFQRTIAEGLRKTQRIFDQKTPIVTDKYSKIMQTKDKNEILRDIYRHTDLNSQSLSRFDVSIQPNEIYSATITGKEAFDLYQTYGFPIEMIIELAQEKNLFVDIESYREELKKHQELSRTASAGMFKGGLADHSEITTKYHTATHLLHAALRKILGTHVQQKGSNITAERLRFDFSQPEKLTEEQIKQVENLVNKQIKANLPVSSEVMEKEQALQSGAIGLFGEKYGDKVTVYTIGPSIGNPSTSSGSLFSKEICGGPHVSTTKKLGQFKIIKEESAGAGVRRIYATLTTAAEE